MVIPMLPSQCLQLFILDLVHGLSLSPAVGGNLLILGTDCGNDAVQVQRVAAVHGQHHGHVRDLGLQLTNLLFIQVPLETDVISQSLQAGLQLYLVHVNFIHIVLDEDKFILHLCVLVDLVLILTLQVLYQLLCVARLHLQSQFLLGQHFQLPLTVVDVALKHIVHVTATPAAALAGESTWPPESYSAIPGSTPYR